MAKGDRYDITKEQAREYERGFNLPDMILFKARRDHLYTEEKRQMSDACSTARREVQEWIAAGRPADVKPMPLRLGGGQKLTAEMVQLDKTTHQQYEVLARAALGKSISIPAAICWAFDREFVPLSEINPEEVPSPGAVSMLKLAKTNMGGLLEKYIRITSGKKGSSVEPSTGSMSHGGADLVALNDGWAEKHLKSVSRVDPGPQDRLAQVPVLPPGPQGSRGQRPIPQKDPRARK